PAGIAGVCAEDDERGDQRRDPEVAPQSATLAGDRIDYCAHARTPAPALSCWTRPSGRGLSEFGCARQPAQAEHAPGLVGEPVGPLDEMAVAAVRHFLAVHLLLVVEAALAVEFVYGDRNVAIGLAHD